MILLYIYFFFHVLITLFLLFRFFTVLIGQFFKEKPIAIAPTSTHDFACIITAYRNLDIAYPLIDSLLKQELTNHLIYVVADNCDTSNWTIHNKQVILLDPPKKLGSKVKSMMYALDNFARPHSAVVVFDPDNIANVDFLTILNNYLQSGFKIVQGRRAAKNLNSVYACLDATSEIYHNYVERELPYRMGSSATIAGSGMAVETPVFKGYLASDEIAKPIANNQVIQGEDKVLHNYAVSQGLQIAFAKDAILYDEKLTSGEQVQRQKMRWLFTYFQNVPNALKMLWKGMVSFNPNQFLFGLFTIYPPIFTLILTAIFVAIIDVFVFPIGFVAISIGLLIFGLNVLWVLAIKKAPKEIWASLWGVPLFIIKQILALLQINKARKDFLPTQHQVKTTIDDLQGKNKKGS